MRRKDFIEATSGKNNTVLEFAGYLISVTGWKSNPWELVKDNNFLITCDRNYEPIASFHTREELWKYLKAL